VPGITAQTIGLVEAQLPAPEGAPDFKQDFEPWFGGEAALAVLPGRGAAADQVQLFEVSDQKKAREFAGSLAQDGSRSLTYRDEELSVSTAGLATGIVGGFLVIGAERGVREVVDTESGAKGAGSLAADASAERARDALPDERLADVYLSEDGIAELVAEPRALLAALAPIVSPDASEGAAVALVASDDGLSLATRSELDPKRVESHPGFFAALPAFSPSLAGSLPAASLGYLGIGDPGKALKGLLEQAGEEAPTLADAVGALVKRVKRLGDVDLERDLLPSLGGEAALALQPPPGESGDGDGEGAGKDTGPQAPFLEFIADDVDEERAGKALARLQGPILDALNPASGLEAPAFREDQVDDVTAHSVRLSGAVDLTYALVGSTLVVATNQAAVQQVVSDEGGLDSTERFEEATDELPDEVSMMGYLDLQGVLTLGEQAGLAEDPAYATFASDLHKLEAMGLSVQSSSSELSADVRLIVGGEARDDQAATGDVPPE
jgi:hypothetical protein